MTIVELPLGHLRLPHFPVPDGQTVESWLRKECQRGLGARYGDGHGGAPGAARLRARRDHLDGLRRLLPDRRRLHPLRPRAAASRRPAAAARPGSIVTYTLGITPVDPIHYELPFERFLNPDRVTMPDIDVDFEDGRRDEVIAYVTRKYGSDHVAQIITFGTMLARAAIRDVGRVLAIGYGEVDRIAKAVPNQLGHQARRGDRDRASSCARWSTRDPAVKRIIDFARQLEGVARNASTHAAGVVISARAADGAHAAPEGDQLRRADDPVRDARRSRRSAC